MEQFDRVEFQHLLTGSRVVVFDKRAILAIVLGDCKGATGTVPNAVFLIIDKVPNPIPVRETVEEVEQKLGFKLGG
jgi:hypothetical protein